MGLRNFVFKNCIFISLEYKQNTSLEKEWNKDVQYKVILLFVVFIPGLYTLLMGVTLEYILLNLVIYGRNLYNNLNYL